MPPAEQVDHVLPVWRGGTSREANLVAACKRCNRAKGARLDWPGLRKLAAGNHPTRGHARLALAMHREGCETRQEYERLRRSRKPTR